MISCTSLLLRGALWPNCPSAESKLFRGVIHEHSGDPPGDFFEHGEFSSTKVKLKFQVSLAPPPAASRIIQKETLGPA